VNNKTTVHVKLVQLYFLYIVVLLQMDYFHNMHLLTVSYTVCINTLYSLIKYMYLCL